MLRSETIDALPGFFFRLNDKQKAEKLRDMGFTKEMKLLSIDGKSFDSTQHACL